MTSGSEQVDSAAGKPSGRLADLVAAPTDGGPARSTAVPTAVKIGVLAVLFCLLNLWQFRNLVLAWLEDANWSHGYIIPLFSLFLLYNRREELLSAPRRTCLWALPLMILALMVQMVSFFPISNLWLCELSMVAVLFFLVLYLLGPGVMRITWLPILYLVLAMPVPGTLYTRVSYPLQELAAQGSTLILRACGVEINVAASNLTIISSSGVLRELTVAEACSGMRSLMAYVALGVAWAYLENRPIWQRLVLVASIIPVAVLCNILRVSITCTAYVVDRPELGQKFMHTFTGMLMLIPALLLFLLLSWTLKRLFVEEEEEDQVEDQAGGGPNGRRTPGKAAT